MPLTVSRPPAAQGIAWVKQGWDLFKSYPVPWAGMTALVFLLLMGVGALPYVGGFLVHALSPFIVAGFLAASRASRNGEIRAAPPPAESSRSPRSGTRSDCDGRL